MTSGSPLVSQDAYPTIEDYVGNTPLVRLQRLSSNPSNVILAKLEGNNPAGSVKDRYSLLLNSASVPLSRHLSKLWGHAYQSGIPSGIR